MTVPGRSIVAMSLPFLILTALAGAANASLVGAGDIAFIRYNADNPDDLAIVLLADADAGQEVHFNNNDYSQAFNVFATSTERFTWEIDTALSAGTVVTFTDLDVQGGGAVSYGSLSRSNSSPTARTMPLSDVGDTVYAFLGTNDSHPTTFLAAITTEGSSRITDAGLTPGQTGVVLSGGTDEAHYIGGRDTETAFADYLPLIGDVGTNWQIRTADTGTLAPPFNATDFTLAGGTTAPEPPQLALMTMLILLLLGCRQQRRITSSAAARAPRGRPHDVADCTW